MSDLPRIFHPDPEAEPYRADQQSAYRVKSDFRVDFTNGGYVEAKDFILDIEGDSATLGKTAGKDAAQDKATFPALIGVEASRRRLADLAGQMAQSLAAVPGDTAALGLLGRRVVERSY